MSRLSLNKRAHTFNADYKIKCLIATCSSAYRLGVRVAGVDGGAALRCDGRGPTARRLPHPLVQGQRHQAHVQVGF